RLAPERVARGLALDHDQHALADAGPDRIDRDQRHAACSTVERERLNQEQFRPFELTILLRRNDSSDDSANLHSSASCCRLPALTPAISNHNQQSAISN